MNKNPKLFRYVVTTLLVSYIYAFIYYLIGGKLDSSVGILFLVSYMFVPMIVSFTLQKNVDKKNIKSLGTIFSIRNKYEWYLLALFTPILINFLAIIVSIIFPNVTFSFGMEGLIFKYKNILSAEELAELKTQIESIPSILIMLVSIIQALIGGATINALAAFGEEAGWRGYMYKQIEDWNFWKASIFTGIIWGIWHFPLIIQGYNYPENPVLGLLMMTIFTVGLSPLMHLIRKKTGSIWGAAIFHGVINASAGFSTMYLVGGSDITNGILGLAGGVALILINVGVYIYLNKIKITITPY